MNKNKYNRLATKSLSMHNKHIKGGDKQHGTRRRIANNEKYENRSHKKMGDMAGNKLAIKFNLM